MKRADVDNMRDMLLARLKGVCEMSREQMLKELPQVCGFKPTDPTTVKEQELIYVMMKFAILGVMSK